MPIYRRTGIARWTAVLGAIAGVVAVPSAALAAPSNDDYNQAFRVNEPGTTLPRDITYNGSTTDATLEQFEIDEAGSCSGNDYGATVHFEVYPDRPGQVRVLVYSAEFLTSVAVWRFTPDDDLHDPICNTAPASNRTADLTYPNSGRVQEGQGYNVQIGGLDEGGSFGEGAYSARFIFYPDTDRDGFLDYEDNCDEQGGRDVDKHQGCPDSDGDGLIDREDACSGEPGDVNKHRGCPDADGDGFPEGSGGTDKCPGLGGANTDRHQGCPDQDRDGVAEGAGANPRDLCETLDPDAVDRNDRKPRDGCPDTLKIETAPFHRGRSSTSGIFVTALGLKLVPVGADVSMTCKLPTGRRCGRLSIDESKKKRVGFKKKLTRKRLPFGTRINAHVTARYATDRYIRIKITRRESYRSRCGRSLKKLGRCD